MLFFDPGFMTLPRRHYDYSNWNLADNYITFIKIIVITPVALLFGQIIFIVNFVVGLFKRLTNRKT